MHELTEHQTLEVGGGLDGAPYGYGSQRFVPPPVEIERPPEPMWYPEPPMPMPSFGG